jgi:hypothetical protein
VCCRTTGTMWYLLTASASFQLMNGLFWGTQALCDPWFCLAQCQILPVRKCSKTSQTSLPPHVSGPSTYVHVLCMYAANWLNWSRQHADHFEIKIILLRLN